MLKDYGLSEEEGIYQGGKKSEGLAFFIYLKRHLSCSMRELCQITSQNNYIAGVSFFVGIKPVRIETTGMVMGKL